TAVGGAPEADMTGPGLSDSRNSRRPTLDLEPRPPAQIGADRYRLAATLLKVPLRLVPTVPMIVTAAKAISAAISPYSIAVTPDSSLISLVKNACIDFS